MQYAFARLIVVIVLLLSSMPAFAIDCSNAKTPPEIAICSNPALKAFDEYLNSVYAKVRQVIPSDVFQDVRRDQRRWIQNRDTKCYSDVPCLMAETQARTAVLNGLAQRYAESNHPGLDQTSPDVTLPFNTAPGSQPLNPKDIYRKAARSVVVIVGFDRSRQAMSQGSGVVIAPDTIATNCHVIDGTEAAAVLFRNKPYQAISVSGDKKIDYCIVRTRDLPAYPVEVASLSTVIPGQRVYTVGSPRGLELTIAEGLISGIRPKEGIPLPLIQTSAPISPGSSGGGLFDEFGRTIGITTFLLKDSQNLNFALPVELSRYVDR